MKVAVRLDDITPDMDWERFLKFKLLLEQYQIKPLIGVVPDNRDEMLVKNRQEQSEDLIPEDFWTYIKELQQEGWVVAMHGCQHRYTTKNRGIFPLNNFSEFAGLPYEEQRRMLADGKKILAEKGIRTDIFMAPAHSYDKNTLKALKETGFRALTDGFGSRPYLWKELIFYPISFKLSSTFRKKQGYSTMVVHAGTVSDLELERYRGYFERKDVKWVSYGEYLQQKPVRRNIFGRGAEFLMAAGKTLAARLLFK